MCQIKEKNKIYTLIDRYLSGQIDEGKFCDEFYYIYDLALDYKSLTEREKQAFFEVGEVASRFSEFEDDHKNYPGVYSTREELQEKIKKTKEYLWDERINSDQFACRVCGKLQGDLPWGEDGKTPTFDVCYCCGVQFGYEDCDEESLRKFRQVWLEQGAKWFVPEEKPKTWVLEEQMKNIPEQYQ